MLWSPRDIERGLPFWHRVVGPQMVEGVTPRLLAVLQLGMDSYYKIFNLRTQVPACCFGGL